MREACQLPIWVLEAAKLPDREQHHRVMQKWLAAQQRRREA
jgi:hypothetical protein